MRYEGGQYYVKSPEEMTQPCFPMRPRLWKIPRKLQTGAMWRLSLAKTKLPQYDVPDGKTAWEYLNELCWSWVWKNVTILSTKELKATAGI